MSGRGKFPSPIGRNVAGGYTQEMAIKAIETHWMGCHFRSRTEARWAVFFEAYGWEWHYEEQGFELESGRRYLPDFRVVPPACDVAFLTSNIEPPYGEMYVEVKPPDFDARNDGRHLYEFVEQVQRPILILAGMPEAKCYGAIIPYSELPEDSEVDFRHLDCLASIDSARASRFEHGQEPQFKPKLREKELRGVNRAWLRQADVRLAKFLSSEADNFDQLEREFSRFGDDVAPDKGYIGDLRELFRDRDLAVALTRIVDSGRCSGEEIRAIDEATAQSRDMLRRAGFGDLRREISELIETKRVRLSELEKEGGRY